MFCFYDGISSSTKRHRFRYLDVFQNKARQCMFSQQKTSFRLQQKTVIASEGFALMNAQTFHHTDLVGKWLLIPKVLKHMQAQVRFSVKHHLFDQIRRFLLWMSAQWWCLMPLKMPFKFRTDGFGGLYSVDLGWNGNDMIAIEPF